MSCFEYNEYLDPFVHLKMLFDFEKYVEAFVLGARSYLFPLHKSFTTSVVVVVVVAERGRWMDEVTKMEHGKKL